MNPPSLYLPGIPTLGVSGQRDNIAVLLNMTGRLLPPGTVVEVTIGHDSACPCVDGTGDLTHCLCEHVNLTLTERTVTEQEAPQ